jgi:hypothetical protein
LLELMSSKEFDEVVKGYYRTKEILLRDTIISYVIFRTRWLLSKRYFWDVTTKEDVLHEIILKVLKILEGKYFRKAKHPCEYMNMVIQNAMCDCVRSEINYRDLIDRSIFVDDFCDIDVESLPKKFMARLLVMLQTYKPINYFGKRYGQVIQDVVAAMKLKPYFNTKCRGRINFKKYGLHSKTIVFLSRFYRREMVEHVKGYYENKNSQSK